MKFVNKIEYAVVFEWSEVGYKTVYMYISYSLLVIPTHWKLLSFISINTSVNIENYLILLLFIIYFAVYFFEMNISKTQDTCFVHLCFHLFSVLFIHWLY